MEQIDRDVMRTHPDMHFFSGDSEDAEQHRKVRPLAPRRAQRGKLGADASRQRAAACIDHHCAALCNLATRAPGARSNHLQPPTHPRR